MMYQWVMVALGQKTQWRTVLITVVTDVIKSQVCMNVCHVLLRIYSIVVYVMVSVCKQTPIYARKSLMTKWLNQASQ